MLTNAGHLRTLVLTCKQLYPPNGGSSLRNWQNIVALKRLGPVAVFAVPGEGVPVGSEPAPGLTTSEVIDLKTDVLWWPLRRALNLRWLVKRQGHPFVSHFTRGAAFAALRALAEDFRPQLVVLEEPWLHEYLAALPGGEVIVFDAHDVQGHLRVAMARGSTGLQGVKQNLAARRSRLIEESLVRNSTQVWTCSSEDLRSFSAMYGVTAPMVVVPNAVDVSYYEQVRGHAAEHSSPAACRTMLFVANFSYAPNAEAGEILVERIFPELIARDPNWRLVLVGSSPTPRMFEASAADSRILVTGVVPDVRSYLSEADVIVVPLKRGGGTRIKILEAFASLRPVVGSAKGAEGIDARDGVHLLIAEEPSEFVDAVLSLASNDSLRTRLVNAAFTLVQASYSWETTARTVESAVRAMGFVRGSR